MAQMYDGDSFYTLSGFGQTGLVILSVAMTWVLLWTAATIMRRLPLPFCVALACVFFYGFVWLSPQVYYTYYMTLFEGLPWQVVVQDAPSFNRLFKLLTFQGRTTLSAHSQGVLGWLLISVAFVAKASWLNRLGVRE